MINDQFNSFQFNDTWLNLWTSVDSWIITATIWPDIDSDKYVFIQMNWTQIVKRINLADFFTRNDNIWIFFLDDNIRNLPNKEITSFSNPFADWGEIVNEKFPDKEITLKLKVVAYDHNSLEATLWDLKNKFNKWGKLQINENWYLRFLDVSLYDFEISAELWLWKMAEINVTFLSVHPIRKSELQTIVKLSQQWNTDTLVSILDSHRDITPELQIVVQSVTWTITSTTFDYNWYSVTYNWPLVEWDILTASWESWLVFINWVESDFDWIITELKADEQTVISTSFVWWTPDYSLYILYYNLYI